MHRVRRGYRHGCRLHGFHAAIGERPRRRPCGHALFPGEANIAKGKVSILTPIGTALIGVSKGQSIDWLARDGQVHRLTVKAVEAEAI
ncbi:MULTISPECIES: GreA/GreB family elongation factor [unclassified Rhizobium]|uniref:GreA/GreB family elongation factor n=1 Tax=unclassified Rhizobium TaxID=2613769 RepID=UPI001FEDFA81|nr:MULTISPECIES: GreA/GreB family elongation factor [unclassified Rhizobium]